jgi:hypothetical protein
MTRLRWWSLSLFVWQGNWHMIILAEESTREYLSSGSVPLCTSSQCSLQRPADRRSQANFFFDYKLSCGTTVKNRGYLWVRLALFGRCSYGGGDGWSSRLTPTASNGTRRPFGMGEHRPSILSIHSLLNPFAASHMQNGGMGERASPANRTTPRSKFNKLASSPNVSSCNHILPIQSSRVGAGIVNVSCYIAK